MKLFQTVQRNFAALGIRTNQPKFNKNLAKSCFIYYFSFFMSIRFLFFEAKTFLEYTSSIYLTTALLVIFTYFTIFILKLEKFFELIDNLEKFFDKSILCSEYDLAGQNIIDFLPIFASNIFQSVKIHHQKQFMTKLIDQ